MRAISHFSRSTQERQVSIVLVFLFGCLGLMLYSSTPGLTNSRINAVFDNKAQKPEVATTCPTCAPPSPQVIYAPLFDIPEAASSEIVLNCRSAHELEITPTFYTLEGTPIVGDAIRLQPAEMRFVDTKSLIPSRERKRHRWGGMTFSYSGNLLEAWAQLTLHGIRGGGSANVFFAVLNQPRANTIEAVWWTPRNGEALIALGNSSNQPIHATLIFSNGQSREVNVAPFATEIVRRRSEDSGESDDDRAAGISINYSGPQGSLIPTGFVSSANGKFTSNIRFYNTPNVVQPNLYANNLRLKDTVPHMVLRNTSPDFLTARPRFLTTAGTPSGMVKLPTLRLRPNEMVEVDLRPLMLAARNRSDLDSVSVQVLNSGAPGSLIGALYSQDRTTGVTYDVPLRDSGSPRASTGAYPVRLDGDYTTVLSITNVTDKQGEFTLQVNYDGGTYELGLVTASPGETKTFDIRKLRDEQTPDRNGHPFPRDLSTGQIRWSLRGNGSVPLFGRSEVVSLREGVSSSYSCVTCCPTSFYDAWIDPGYVSVFPEEALTTTPRERQRDCYGNIYGPYDGGWGAWYSSNSDVITVSSGDVTGIGAGTATFYFTRTTYYWMQDFDEMCIPFESSDTESGTAEVPSEDILLNNANVYAVSESFVAFNIATLALKNSQHGSAICQADDDFTLRINFTLPTGGELNASHCKADSYGDNPDWIVYGSRTCTMDGTLTGHLNMTVHRVYGLGSSDSNPKIVFVVGGYKSGQGSSIDTRGTVNLLCSQ